MHAFETSIPHQVSTGAAMRAGAPTIVLEPGSRIASAYHEAADELLALLTAAEGGLESGSAMPRRRRTGAVLPGDAARPARSPDAGARTDGVPGQRAAEAAPGRRTVPPPPSSSDLTFGDEREERVNLRIYPSRWRAYEQLLLELRLFASCLMLSSCTLGKQHGECERQGPRAT